MSTRSIHERVVERHGYKYIRLKSGRWISFLQAIRAAEAAQTDLGRAVSRAFKLVDDDYDLERLDWFVENLEWYLSALRKEIEKRRGVKTQEDRIALLRNTSGRTPEEAAVFRRKADELERRLEEERR